jgi:lysophospholipase L1-like esterase
MSITLAALTISGVAATASGAEPTPLAPAAAIEEPTEPTPLTVLLMGDSYTAGNGARAANGERSYYGPAKCMRSRDTWGEQYADTLGAQGYAVTLLNRACSAATTDHMLGERYLKRTDTLQYPEPESVERPRTQEFYTAWATQSPQCTATPNSDEYIVTSVTRGAGVDGERTVSVNCARWLRPQVDALNPNVDLILFTVGGNDAHFPDIMRQCLVMGSAPGCADALKVAEQYVTEDFADDLAVVLDEMHARTGGHAKVVYLGYPRLEVSTDLTLTSVVDGELVQLPVAAELDRLIELGAQAQKQAADAANARYGEGFVTYLDGMRDLFAGHEPDARPGIANPDRWIAEAFETNVKDEWYHFRPEGQEAIAHYVASFGTFGATGGEPARDLALVTDGSPGALAAMAYAAREEVLSGANVSIVEQRRAAEGAGLEQRIVAQGLDSRGVAEWAANGTDDLSGWAPADEVTLEARWNAAQQVVYVGDASVGTEHLANLWDGSRQGLGVTPQVAVIDTGDAASSLSGSYVWAPAAPGGPVAEALAAMAAAPHAWAAGPYATVASGGLMLDATGSYGAGALSYAWDLDRDGVFEHTADGPLTLAETRDISVGWVAVQVTAANGSSTIARSWILPGMGTLIDFTGACAGEFGVGGTGGGQACQPLESDAPWSDGTENAVTLIQPSASADAEHTALLAWLADPQLFIEERGTRALAISVRAGASGTRASSPSRRRPAQLVRRERGLQILLDEPVRIDDSGRAEAAGFALAA